MNYFYEPAAAARLSAYVEFLCPVAGAQPVMRRFDPALAGQQLIFPSPELLATTYCFRLLEPAISSAYTRRFAAVLGL